MERLLMGVIIGIGMTNVWRAALTVIRRRLPLPPPMRALPPPRRSRPRKQ